MNLTNVITAGHPGSAFMVVVDKAGKEIKGVISYNIETREAVVYELDEAGMILKDKKTKQVVLRGSKLMFVKMDTK